MLRPSEREAVTTWWDIGQHFFAGMRAGLLICAIAGSPFLLFLGLTVN